MDPLRRMPPAWLRWVGLAAVVGVAGGLALLALALPWRLVVSLLWGGPVALLGAAALVWLVLRLRARGAWAGAVLAGCILAVPIYVGVLEGVLPGVRAIWVSERLAATLRRAAPGLDPAQFGVTGYAEPSMVFALGTATHLLGSGEDAARFLAAQPGRVVAVGNRSEAAFQREATRLGVTAAEIGMVTGLNYTRGRFLTLQLYRVAETLVR
jgi:hypothetical protein